MTSKPRLKLAFQRISITAVFVTFCFALPLWSADSASVTFILDFPNSSPEHYSISVQNDGSAHYESTGKLTADSDVRDDYQTDFTLSDAALARIFELSAQAKYFSGK